MGIVSRELFHRRFAPGWTSEILCGALLVGLTAGLAAVAVARPPPSAAAAASPATGVSPGALLRRAVTAIGRGEDQLAENLLAAVAERHPIVADYADLLRMRLLVESERFDEAIELARYAIELDPYSPVVRFERRAHRVVVASQQLLRALVAEPLREGCR